MKYTGDQKNNILHKELDLIQAAINRMAQNSFLIKGWFFTLLTALSLWEFKSIIMFSIIILFLSLIFYALNLQFYIYERCFRDLYKSRIELRTVKKNYHDHLYSLDFSEYKNKWYTYIGQNPMLLFTYFCVSLTLICAKIAIIYTKKTETLLQFPTDRITIIMNFFNF